MSYKIPVIIPAGWEEIRRADDGVMLRRNVDQMTLIFSVAEYDGTEWLHLSIAKRDRLPTWNDLKKVRELFLPANKTAIQVLPPADKYVNIHKYCLHLFCCTGRDPLPDFTRGTGTI